MDIRIVRRSPSRRFWDEFKVHVLRRASTAEDTGKVHHCISPYPDKDATHHTFRQFLTRIPTRIHGPHLPPQIALRNVLSLHGPSATTHEFLSGLAAKQRHLSVVFSTF